jgi:hypothetical protein
VFRPSCALSIAFLVACLAGVGCGGSTKTIAGSPPAGTASQPGTVAPAGGSSTKTAGSSTTPGSATGGTGSTSTPETQPLTGGSTPGTSRTSTGSTTPSSTTKSKTSVTPSSVQAACEHAIAQKPGISAALKAKAEQICKQAANRVLSRSSTLEREVCMRVVNSSKVSPEVKAQALARCRGL